MMFDFRGGPKMTQKNRTSFMHDPLGYLNAQSDVVFWFNSGKNE